jgi:propanol-preferring alcohol dehydrogenase
MIGKDRDGGYAEYIVVPECNAIRIPDGVADQHAAVMMCSSATALHAIRKARLEEGDAIAVFGCGGLGVSAIMISRILGADPIFAIDRNPDKLALAESLGALPVDASSTDAASEILRLTRGSGVDVCLELVGSPVTVQQAVRSVGIGGRVAVAGITNEDVPLNPYTEIIAREAEVIGVSDHIPEEISQLLTWTAEGSFALDHAIGGSVALDASRIEAVFIDLKRGVAPARTVILP